MFDITRDIAVLRKVFTDKPAIKVLIIDPLTAYLGAGAKAKENTDVRRVLTPLVKLAEEFGVLLLANNHLNKNGGKALYRILDFHRIRRVRAHHPSRRDGCRQSR